MEKRSIRQQVAANHRASVVITLLMVLLLAGLGALAVLPFSPWHSWIGALVGASLAFFAGLFGFVKGSHWIVDSSRALPASSMKHRQLLNAVEEMAVAANIRMPAVYVSSDSSPNAFATCFPTGLGVICVTQGLIDVLSRDELQAVVAHEVAHLRNGDVKFMTMVVFIAGVVPFICDLLIEMFWHGAGDMLESDFRSIWIIIAATVVIIILLAVSPIFTTILRLAISRKREFLADASAAELTRNPQALMDALVKLTHNPKRLKWANRATEHMYIVNPFKGHEDRGGALLSTHPPVYERVKALQRLMGTGPTIRLGEEASEMA